MIERRRVIYLHAYDPQGAAGYYRLFRQGWSRFKDLWSVESNLGALNLESDELASWTVNTAGPDWQVSTTYEFIRYEDILNFNLGRPILRQTLDALRWHVDDLFNAKSVRPLQWRFATYMGVLRLLSVGWIAIAIASGLLAAMAAHDVLGLPAWTLVPIWVCIAALVFYALRPLAERLFVIRINNCWISLAPFSRGEATRFDRPIATGVARLLSAVNGGETDEILLVGHSAGAPLALAIMARALEQDPDLGRRGARITVLSLGSVMPIIGLHPRAQWMRDIVKRVAVEPSVRWIDCQSVNDLLNFWNFDPVAGMGVEAVPQRFNPVIWTFGFRAAMTPERFRLLQYNFFRMHFQFIMAAEIRVSYDYFMLVCGPFAAIDWAQRGGELVSQWMPGHPSSVSAVTKSAADAEINYARAAGIGE